MWHLFAFMKASRMCVLSTFVSQAIYLMTDYKPTEESEMPEVRTREIFNRMDTNGDGVLSKDEFIRGCLGDQRLFKLLACSSGGSGGEVLPVPAEDLASRCCLFQRRIKRRSAANSRLHVTNIGFRTRQFGANGKGVGL